MFDVLSTLCSVGAAVGGLGASFVAAPLSAAGDSPHAPSSARARPTRRGVPATRSIDRSRPVLLLHGFASSPEVMLPLARRIERRLRRPVTVVQTSAGKDDIRDCAREVSAVLQTLAQAPDFQFADVVGHSMGGLVGTWLLKKLDRGRHVRRVVTLGSPHRGAPLAAAGSLLLAGRSRAMRQMIPGSCFLRELEWAAVPAGSRLLSIAGDADQLVPTRFARVTPMHRQSNLVIAGVAHLRLIFSSATLRALCDGLSTASVGNPARPAASVATPGADEAPRAASASRGGLRRLLAA